jgi:hypothetical protein
MANATISSSTSAGATLTNATDANGVPLQDTSRVTVQSQNAAISGSGRFYDVSFGSGADTLIATNMIWVRPPSGASIGFDSINMGAGNDYLAFDRSAAHKVITMGDGNDTLIFKNSGARGANMGAGNDVTQLIGNKQVSEAELAQKSGAPTPNYDGGSGMDTLQLGRDWSVTLSSGNFVLDTNNDGFADTTVSSVSNLNFSQVLSMPTLLNGTVSWGTVTLSNGTTIANVATFSNYEVLQAVCFTAGSLIATPDGPVPVEQLAVGDQVMTRAGPRSVVWAGKRRLDVVDLMANPKLLPIRIAAGALGPGLPERDVMFSPQHRIVLRAAIARQMFGAEEVLVPAKHLVGLEGVDVAGETRQVSYHHLMLDAHEVVQVEGIEAETLYPGKQALVALTKDAREEVMTLFPELRDQDAPTPVAACMPLLKGREARALIARLKREARQAVSAPLARHATRVAGPLASRDGRHVKAPEPEAKPWV